MIDRLLEAYLLAFMALKTRVSKAVTSFVFESRLVQWLTEGELYEALFANLQRKLWATEGRPTSSQCGISRWSCLV